MADTRSPLLNIPIPDESNLTNEEFIRLRDALLAVDTFIQTNIDDIGDKAPVSHDHTVDDVDGLRSELDQLRFDVDAVGDLSLDDLTDVDVVSATNGQVLLMIAGTWQAATISADNVSYEAGTVSSQLSAIDTALSGKANASHTHEINDVNGLLSALADKAGVSHSHAIENITNLQTALDGKLSSTGKAADADKLDGLNSSQFVRSDASDTMTGSLSVTGNVTAQEQLFVGKNGGGDSWAQFYDDNSNTWRALGWDDSANAFLAETQQGNGYIVTMSTTSSATATSYPLGHFGVMAYGGTNKNMNEQAYPKNGSSLLWGTTGSSLSGTWRARGRLEVNSTNRFYIVQRVA